MKTTTSELLKAYIDVFLSVEMKTAAAKAIAPLTVKSFLRSEKGIELMENSARQVGLTFIHYLKNIDPGLAINMTKHLFDFLDIERKSAYKAKRITTKPREQKIRFFEDLEWILFRHRVSIDSIYLYKNRTMRGDMFARFHEQNDEYVHLTGEINHRFAGAMAKNLKNITAERYAYSKGDEHGRRDYLRQSKENYSPPVRAGRYREIYDAGYYVTFNGLPF